MPLFRLLNYAGEDAPAHQRGDLFYAFGRTGVARLSVLRGDPCTDGKGLHWFPLVPVCDLPIGDMDVTVRHCCATTVTGSYFPPSLLLLRCFPPFRRLHSSRIFFLPFPCLSRTRFSTSNSPAAADATSCNKWPTLRLLSVLSPLIRTTGRVSSPAMPSGTSAALSTSLNARFPSSVFFW